MKEKLDKQDETIHAWKQRAENAEKALREAQNEARRLAYDLQAVHDGDPDCYYLLGKIDRQRREIQKLHEQLGNEQNLPGSVKPDQPSRFTICEDGWDLGMKDRPPRQKRPRLSTDPDGRTYILSEAL